MPLDSENKKRKRKKKTSSGGRIGDDSQKLIKELSKPKRERKSTSSSKPKTAKQLKRSLDPLREQLRVLVNQANKRANDILIAGKPSRAMEEARRSWSRLRSRAEDDELFKSELKTRKQINREFARVHAFLNDYTSTLTGAEDLLTDMTRLEGSWKEGVFKDNSGVRDEDISSKTFEIYRKVVEAAGGWERAVGLIQGKEGLIGYGSENLINNIYDMVENNYDEEEIMVIALEQVEAGIAAYEEMSSKQVADYDYGIVFDDESAMERKQFYIWRSQYRKGK